MTHEFSATDVSEIRLGFVVGNLFTVTNGSDFESMGNPRDRLNQIRIALDRLPLIITESSMKAQLATRILATVESLEFDFEHCTEAIEHAGFEHFIQCLHDHVLGLRTDLETAVPDTHKTFFQLGFCLGFSCFKPGSMTSDSEIDPRTAIISSLKTSEWHFLEPALLQSCFNATGLNSQTFLGADQVECFERMSILNLSSRYLLWPQIETRITQLASIGDRISEILLPKDHNSPLRRHIGAGTKEADLTASELALFERFFTATDYVMTKEALVSCWKEITGKTCDPKGNAISSRIESLNRKLGVLQLKIQLRSKSSNSSWKLTELPDDPKV